MTSFDPQDAERLADLLPGKRPVEVEAATMLRAAAERVRELEAQKDKWRSVAWDLRKKVEEVVPRLDTRLAAAEKVIEAAREVHGQSIIAFGLASDPPEDDFDGAQKALAQALQEYDRA